MRSTPLTPTVALLPMITIAGPLHQSRQHRRLTATRTHHSPQPLTASSSSSSSENKHSAQPAVQSSSRNNAAGHAVTIRSLIHASRLLRSHCFSTLFTTGGNAQQLLPFSNIPLHFSSMSYSPPAAGAMAGMPPCGQPVLTVRALAAGLLVGAVLCFSNTYFGLQTGWVTMGSLQVRFGGSSPAGSSKQLVG